MFRVNDNIRHNFYLRARPLTENICNPDCHYLLKPFLFIFGRHECLLGLVPEPKTGLFRTRLCKLAQETVEDTEGPYEYDSLIP